MSRISVLGRLKQKTEFEASLECTASPCQRRRKTGRKILLFVPSWTVIFYSKRTGHLHGLYYLVTETLLLQTHWAPLRTALSSHQNSASGITCAEAIPWLLSSLRPSYPSLTTPLWLYSRAPHFYYVLLLPYLVWAFSRLLTPWSRTFCSYLLALWSALLTTSHAFQGSSNISPWLMSSS